MGASAAVGDALTQTSAVVLGLQPKFDWRGVAASAVGAGVGHAVGDALGLRADTTGQSPGVQTFTQLAKRLATGLLAGTAAAVARGGKVAIQRVATDAFGQALADGFMDGLREPVRAVGGGGGYSGGSGRSGGAGGSSGSAMAAGWGDRNGSDVQSDGYAPDPLGEFIAENLPAWEQRGANTQQVWDAFGPSALGTNPYAAGSDGVMLAAGPGYSGGVGRPAPFVAPANYNDVNGLDLPEGCGLQGPAGDERLGEDLLLPRGRSRKSASMTLDEFRQREIQDGYEAARIAQPEQQNAQWDQLRQGAWKLLTAQPPSVSAGYKAASAAAGMVSDGLGVLAGVAITGTGVGLTTVPEPTTLTKWAGLPLVAYGATYTTKSAVGFGLNATNFLTAIRGITDEGAYLPGSLLEWSVRSAGGSPDQERFAAATDMAWGVANGKLLDARIATGVVTNPRIAALLQPATVTSVGREATLASPQTWRAWTKLDPKAGAVDWLFKTNDNIIVPEFVNRRDRPGEMK